MPNVFSKLPFLMSDEDEIDTRYAKTILYCLSHKDDVITKNRIYIGHTINKRSRVANHKHHTIDPTALEYKDRKYKYIRENGGWENWVITHLEIYNCRNQFDAEDREEFWKIKHPAILNKLKSGESRRLGGKVNYGKSYNDEWYIKNREKTLEIKRRKGKCEICGQQITLNYMKRHQKGSNCKSLQVA